jgi:hypothetical protein
MSLSLLHFKDVKLMKTVELEQTKTDLLKTSKKGKSWIVRRAARSDLEQVEAELKARSQS